MPIPENQSAAMLVRELIAARAPLAWRTAPIGDEVELGANGLGLDSIAIVELLLDCEQATSGPFPPALFDDGPLTVGRLIAHAARFDADAMG